MIEKILVPLDGSALADSILTQVRRVLIRSDAEVLLVRVIPESLPRESGASLDQLKEIAIRELETRRDLLTMQGARAVSRLLMGDPAQSILNVALDYGPSLVALATHGRTGLARWIRGSVAERVLRGSSLPLLLVNPFALEEGAPPAEARFERILVALDGSEASERILPLVGEIARLYESQVILFHAIDTLAGGPPAEYKLLGSPKEARAALERARSRLGWDRVRTRIVPDAKVTAASILDAAEEEEASLLALTTHGRSGPSRWVFGSVAEHVIRHARCPLLVQRQETAHSLA
jgi:nucleotide-binding universal stress UspA family protein